MPKLAPLLMRYLLLLCLIFANAVWALEQTMPTSESATDPMPALRLAVAANFISTAKQLGAMYQAQYHQAVTVSSGSTGMLYAQILHGAPYDVFLAANSKHPQQLEQQGLIIAGSRHSYALGKLVFWCPSCQSPNLSTLQQWQGKLAIANPALAPYGTAAQAFMQQQHLQSRLEAFLVQGNNVGQVYQFVQTGNAKGGFLAASQVSAEQAMHVWAIPADQYPAIEQQVVLLKNSSQAKQAQQFLSFMLSVRGQAVIEQAGYRQASSLAESQP